jgi:hypothetical protein
MLDGETFARQRATASTYDVKGVAIWRIGLEDAGVWGKAVRGTRIGPGNAIQPPPVCFLLPTK